MKGSRRWAGRLLLAGLAVVSVGVGAWVARGRLARDPMATGRSAYARRDWDGATSIALRRLGEAPDDRDALRLLARSHARARRDDPARRIFLRLGPAEWRGEDLYLLAEALGRQGRPTLALATLANALKAEPGHAEALELMARIDLDQGRPVEAARVAGRLAALAGWESRGGLLLARARDRAGDPAGAAGALGRVLDRDPTLAGTGTPAAVARKDLARSLLRSGRPEEAGRRLDGRADDPEAAWLLGRARLRRGASAEAVALAGRFGAGDPLRAEPAPFVGASRCAGCHPEIHRAQQASRHAKTIGAGPTLSGIAPTGRPIDDPARPGVTHAIRRDGDRLAYEVSAEGRVYRAAIEFALGSGDRGQTFVGRDESGRAHELRLSRYESGSSWDLTTGQDPHPARPDELLGRPLDDDELLTCLGCHTTRAAPIEGRPAPATADRAIGCERCHGPGANHLDAVAARLDDPAIARPRLATAGAILGLCGACHGLAAAPASPSAPISPRFQAPALARSRCYNESKGALSCVTCHDPHRDATRDARHYEAKCLSCHDPGAPKAPGRASACAVNPRADCLGCHMPPVGEAMRHSSFTDHEIRVRPAPTPGR